MTTVIYNSWERFAAGGWSQGGFGDTNKYKQQPCVSSRAELRGAQRDIRAAQGGPAVTHTRTLSLQGVHNTPNFPSHWYRQLQLHH